MSDDTVAVCLVVAFFLPLCLVVIMSLTFLVVQVFCGNFEYDARAREIERLFEIYGPIDRVEMKTGETFFLSSTRRSPSINRDMNPFSFTHTHSLTVHNPRSVLLSIHALNQSINHTTLAFKSILFPVTKGQVYCQQWTMSCISVFIAVVTGFAFVYMKDRRDAEDAIRRLDG